MLRIWWTLAKHFLPPAGCGSLFPARSCWDAWRSERLSFGERSGEYGSWAKFVQLLKHWLCNMQSGIVMEKHWALSVNQHRLQTLQFSVHLVNLPSILVRCNDFSGIQKVVVDQTGSIPPTQIMTFFWCKFGFGKCFGAFSLSSHWAGHHQLSYKIHFPFHKKWFVVAYRKRRRPFKMTIFLICGRSWGIHLSSFSTFPISSDGKGP